jgi:hypothetical protein
MRFSPPRTLLTIAVTGMALVMVAGPTVAHDEGDSDAHRGIVGRHVFVDSKDRPGARCRYHAIDHVTDVAPTVDVAEFVGVAVRPPKVGAVKRLRYQPVGWRFVLQEKLPDGEWTKVKRSPLQIAKGGHRHAARFSRMRVRYNGDPDADYRVVTKAYWFRRHRRVMGVATHLVYFYMVRDEVTEGSCPGSVPTSDAP